MGNTQSESNSGDKAPEIVSNPESCDSVTPGETASFSVQATGDDPLEYLWEHQSVTGEQPVDYEGFSSARKAKGKAAADTLQNCYSVLTKQITPGDIAPELFAEKIINENDVEKAKNLLYLKQYRAQELLLTLMRKVQAKPEWFDTICNILEKESVTAVENMRTQFEKAVKKIDGWQTMSNDGVRFAGVDTATLTVSQIQQSDEGNYRCTVSNGSGKVTSKVARLRITPEPPMVLTCPVDSCNVSVKQSATFAVTATGSKPLKYQWQRNTLTETAENWKPLAPDGNSYQGADTATLTFPSVGKDDVGRYRCQISNEVGKVVSNSAVLTVAEPPKIVLSPESANDVIPCMDSVSFTVEATGVEPIEYQWEKRSADGEDSWEPLHASDESFEGVKSNTLTISTVQDCHEGEYRCVLRNPNGSTTSNSAALSLVNPDYVILQFLEKVCAAKEGSSVDEIETFIQKYGTKSEIVRRCLMTIINMDTEHQEVVEVFLQFAAPNFEQNGMTLLQCACMKGHSKIVWLLLQNGASKVVITEDGRTLLHLACERGHSQVLVPLLFNKVDVNSQDKSQRTPLHAACEVFKDLPSQKLALDMIDNLLNKGARVDVTDEAWQTPLHIACVRGSTHLIKELLKVDSCLKAINSEDKGGNTPFHLICKGGFSEVAELLLSKGASCTSQNENGNTPFHLACKGGYLEVVQKLLHDKRWHCCTNIANKEGNTPLHLACDKGFSEVVKKILKKSDSSINAKNQEGNTPLHLAACGGFRDLAHFLVQKGGDLHLFNKEGSTPAMLAHVKQHPELATELTPKRKKHQKARPCTSYTPDTRKQIYTSRSSFTKMRERCASMSPRATNSLSSVNGRASLHESFIWPGYSSAEMSPARRGHSISHKSVHDQSTIKALAAVAAFEKCFDTLAMDLDPGRVAPTLFARNVINSESIREARAINLLLTLLEKIRTEPKVFSVICQVLEDNGVSAVTVLRAEFERQVLRLELEKACCEEEVEALETALEKCGADSEIARTALMAVTNMEKESIKVATVFLKCGTPVEFEVDGWTPLQRACVKGHWKIAKLLQENGANLKVQSEDQKSLLHLACENGCGGVVHLLLGIYRKDISLDQTDQFGRTPLHTACAAAAKLLARDMNVVEMSKEKEVLGLIENLLNCEAKFNLKDKDGNTALHLACESGILKVVCELLAKDTECKTINSKNTLQNTPLHLAAGAGFSDIVEMLLKQGGDPTVVNQAGLTPVDIAKTNGHCSVVECFQKKWKFSTFFA